MTIQQEIFASYRVDIDKLLRGWLIDTCLDGQDTVKKYLDYFNIQYK